jgi:hypothetical protein
LLAQDVLAEAERPMMATRMGGMMDVALLSWALRVLPEKAVLWRFICVPECLFVSTNTIFNHIFNQHRRSNPL